MAFISTEATSSQRKGIWATIVGVVIFVVVIVGGFVYTMTAPRAMSDAELKANGAYLFEAARDIGEFSLQNANGQAFTPADLQGQWSLLFFGFTHCPDICPTTMALLKQMYDQLEPDLQRSTQIVLVSVDPARDTPEKLLPYVQYFDPSFVGVTGEFLDLHRFATALNIPFRKVMLEDGNYTMDHSGNIVMINPKGHYVGFFKAPQELARLKATYRSIRAQSDL